MAMKKKNSTANLTRATWPPLPSPDESEEMRMQRQKEEQEAKRVSDSIDKAIGAERENKRKTSNAKILLLGTRILHVVAGGFDFDRNSINRAS